VRQLSDAYRQANTAYSREPRFYAKILNDTKTIYITSHSDITIVDVGSEIFSGVLTSSVGNSQKITPERGYSTIGGASLSLKDLGFTELLRDLKDNFNDTLNNNKVELYTGFKDLDTADYTLIIPMYVTGIDNNELDYILKLSDTQRFVKKSIFKNLALTKVVTSLGYDTGSIEVVSSDEFNRVEHDSGWTDAPSATVGYFSISGTNEYGEDIEEIARWTSAPDSTHFIVDARGLFGTRPVDIVGSIDEGSSELKELVYLDLPVPKMILALMTGDLLNQVGATLPDSWHAAVEASLISLSSFVNIGDDLSNFNLQFIGESDQEAKGFIANQCMAPMNLFTFINQNGELNLKRFSAQSLVSPGNLILDYDKLTAISPIERDAKSIRNIFSINWEWQFSGEYFARRDIYIDGDSIARNNQTSVDYQLDLRGIRNSGREAKTSLDSLAEGIRARFSEPRVIPTASCLIRDTIELEVGDVVLLDLPNQPDFASPDTLFSSFEVQGITWDFLAGTSVLSLFGSSGSATPIGLTSGEDIPLLTHDGSWTDITGVLTGTDSGGTFTVTANGNLPSGKYFYDGNIVINTGITVTFNGSTWIDCLDFSIIGTGKMDGAGRSGVLTAGFFGGNDSAQEGMKRTFDGSLFPDSYYVRQTPGKNSDKIAASNTVVPSGTLATIDEANNLTGIDFSAALYGNAGGTGGTLVFRSQVLDSEDDHLGGDKVSGGAGLGLICTNLFATNKSIITNGSDNDFTVGNATAAGGGSGDFYAGAGGFGWPGAVLCYLKDRTSVVPSIRNIVEARTGSWDEADGFTVGFRPKTNGARTRQNRSSGDKIAPIFPSQAALADNDFSSDASIVYRIAKASDHVPVPGTDITPTAKLPTLSTIEEVNLPKTPLGNQTTVTITAVAAIGDDAYSYTQFAYRLKGQLQWVPISYGIRNESTVTVVADGSTYEFSGQPVNNQGVASTGRSIIEHTVKLVSKDSDVGDATPSIPPIQRLELVNSVTGQGGDGWDQWKGPDAIFRWAKLSITNSGNIVTPNGILDLHLDGYRISIYDSSDNLLREEIVRDSTFTYTLEKNRRDTNLNPVRNLKFQIQAVTVSGFEGEVSELIVSNPAPSVPANVTYNPGFSSIAINFDFPNDLDFVGVNLYIAESPTDPLTIDPILLTGNNTIRDALDSGTTYGIVLESVDQFGIGAQTTQANIVTDLINAQNIGDLTGTITLDENGGQIITNNDNFISVMGAVDRAGFGNGTLVFHTWDGNTAPFWVDSAGDAAFSGTVTASTFVGGLVSNVEGASFGDDGYQLGVFGGIPKFHVGNGNKFVQFDGTNIVTGKESVLRGVRSFNTDQLIWYDNMVGVDVIQKSAGATFSFNQQQGLIITVPSSALDEWTHTVVGRTGVSLTGQKINMEKNGRLKVGMTGSASTNGTVYVLAGSKNILIDTTGSFDRNWGFKLEGNVAFAYYQEGNTRRIATTGITVTTNKSIFEVEYFGLEGRCLVTVIDEFGVIVGTSQVISTPATGSVFEIWTHQIHRSIAQGVVSRSTILSDIFIEQDA
jgi:hypothetical protein